MHILRPHPRPLESETESRAQQPVLWQALQKIWCLSKFRNHCSRELDLRQCWMNEWMNELPKPERFNPAWCPLKGLVCELPHPSFHGQRAFCPVTDSRTHLGLAKPLGHTPHALSFARCYSPAAWFPQVDPLPSEVQTKNCSQRRDWLHPHLEPQLLGLGQNFPPVLSGSKRRKGGKTHTIISINEEKASDKITLSW